MSRVCKSTWVWTLAIVSALVSVNGVAAIEDEKPKSQPAKETASSAKADKDKSPTTAPADEEVRTQKQPSAEEILRAFQEDERPVLEPMLPTKESMPTPGPRDPTGPNLKNRPRLPDGYYLDDRLGRLERDGTWYTFVFDSEDPEKATPPMKLLPNRLLEMMVRETEGSADPVQFTVSGEITDFLNENYLLLRKSLRKRPSGNLKK